MESRRGSTSTACACEPRERRPVRIENSTANTEIPRTARKKQPSAAESDATGAELKQFIEQTLVEILQGLRAAHATEANVAPSLKPGEDGTMKIDPAFGVAFHNGEMFTVAEFDIAVTAQKSKEGGGGFSLRIPWFDLGAKADAKMSTGDERISRVKFRTHIRLDVTST